MTVSHEKFDLATRYLTKMAIENEAESYKYWYTSAKGALSILLNNSKISAEKRRNKGRIEAGMHDIDMDYMMKMWELQEGRCIYSGIPMNYDINEFRVSIDRIDNNKGYVKGSSTRMPSRFSTSLTYNYRLLWWKRTHPALRNLLLLHPSYPREYPTLAQEKKRSRHKSSTTTRPTF